MTDSIRQAGSVRIFMPLADTARLLGVTPDELDDLLENGALSCVEYEGEWLVETDSVIRYARSKDNA